MTDTQLQTLQLEKTSAEKLGIQVVRTYSSGRLSSGRILALAAVSPVGTQDPIDLALAASLKANRPDIKRVQVAPEDFDPASPERKFSLARVEGIEYELGVTKDIVVMRGELRSVLNHANLDRESRKSLIKNADMLKMRERRALTVATAPLNPDGTFGDFKVEGFVAVGLMSGATTAEDMATNPSHWIRVNVWTPLLRWQHWINVALIFTMSCTGYLIMDPFVGPTASAGLETGYLMGWIRLIHFVAAFLWLALGFTRLVLAFTAPDKQLRWRAMWPLNSKEDVSNLGKTAAHYLFIRKEAPLYVGHNPLQQLAYTSVYIACGVQMITGMALYSLYQQSSWIWAFLATPVHWFGIPTVRLIHAVLMFLLWAFVIMHVYLAIRADSLDRHGGLSSMVNGAVWLRRGSKPVDAPKIG